MLKFREYSQDQGLVLPPYLDELIEEHHLVRVVNSVVDGLDMKLLSKPFKASFHQQGGSPPYHPGMMLKVIVYSYANGIRTCRKIAKQLRENVHYMWLSGMQQPDFRTINRYRSVYFKDILEEIFSSVIQFLLEKRLVEYKTVFVDGTKISADANKHKIVWDKNVQRYKKQLQERTRCLFKEIDALNEAEDERYGSFDLPECGEQSDLSSEDLHSVADSLSETLSCDGKKCRKETDKQLRKASRQLKRDADKLARYEEQERKLGGRNSYSKTDPDATAMRMKNDELRPGYNVQVVSENGFIVGASVSQNANDGTSFIPLMEEMDSALLPEPDEIVADAGYGHEEVYEYLEERNIDAFIKYPSYHAENSRESKYRFHYSRFTYDRIRDVFICPLGRQLYFIEEGETRNKSGFVVHQRKYQSSACSDCPYKSQCTNSTVGRTLTVNMNLRRHQQKARDNLEGVYGESLRKRRGYEIETVFGDWKHNLKFQRFQLRGLDKVRAELFFHSLAYNLRKIMKVWKSFSPDLYRFFKYIYRLITQKLDLMILLSTNFNKSSIYE